MSPGFKRAHEALIINGRSSSEEKGFWCVGEQKISPKIFYSLLTSFVTKEIYEEQRIQLDRNKINLVTFNLKQVCFYNFRFANYESKVRIQIQNLKKMVDSKN